MSDLDFSALASQLTGALLTPDDPGFAPELAGFKLLYTQHPLAVIAAETPDDVVATVRFAREHFLPLRIQATGHGAHESVTDGLIVSTKHLTAVTVDPVAKTATFGGGTPWGLVVAAAAPHGLAPVIGSSPSVGAVGFLLGGGMGPMVRSFGFGSDHLVSLRVVTGRGELVTASAAENLELFWALRGGKGGLGVVVEATVSLVELPSLSAGSLLFDIEHGAAVLDGWLDWTATAPDGVSTSVAILKFPDIEQVPPPLRARHLISLRFAAPGPIDEGERLAAPLRALAPVYLDGLGEMAPADVARIHSDPTEPTLGWGRGLGLTQLDHDFVGTLLGFVGAGTNAPFLGVELRHVAGVKNIDVPGGSAVGGRELPFILQIIGAPNPALLAEVLPAAFAELHHAIASWISDTTTINWVSDPEDAAEFSQAWSPATRERLESVRREFDPDGVFPYGPRGS